MNQQYKDSLYVVSFFRLLQKDNSNLEALWMVALHSLCREGNITEVKVTVSHVHSLNLQLSQNPNVKVDLYNGDEQRAHLMKLFMCFHLLCQSVKHLSDLFSSLNFLEPQSPELFYKMSLAFTRTVRYFFSFHSELFNTIIYVTFF